MLCFLCSAEEDKEHISSVHICVLWICVYLHFLKISSKKPIKQTKSVYFDSWKKLATIWTVGPSVSILLHILYSSRKFRWLFVYPEYKLQFPVSLAVRCSMWLNISQRDRMCALSRSKNRYALLFDLSSFLQTATQMWW